MFTRPSARSLICWALLLTLLCGPCSHAQAMGAEPPGHGHIVTAEVGACGGRQDCTRAAEDRFRAWNAGKHRYDEALAQAFRPTYRLLTGLVANVSDPLAYLLYCPGTRE